MFCSFKGGGNSNEKHFLVQVVDDANNDFLADRIYEELVKRGFIAGRAKNSELKSVNTDAFDKFIMFYPIQHFFIKHSIFNRKNKRICLCI